MLLGEQLHHASQPRDSPKVFRLVMALWIVVSILQLGESIENAAGKAYNLIRHQACGVTGRHEGAIYTSEQREEEFNLVARNFAFTDPAGNILVRNAFVEVMKVSS